MPPIEKAPDISVIVPAKNEEVRICRLFEDLKAQDTYASVLGRRLTLETIVADAGSDSTAEVARHYGAVVVEGGFPSAGRNRGAAKSKGRVIYFVDADVRLPSPGFISRTYNKMIELGLDIGGVDILPLLDEINGKPLMLAVAALYSFTNWYVRLHAQKKHKLAQGGCIIANRKAFEALRGFNEEVYWGEDSELAKRASCTGCRFGLLDSGSFVYASPRNLSHDSWKSFARYIRNAKRLDALRRQGVEITQPRYAAVTGSSSYFLPRSPVSTHR